VRAREDRWRSAVTNCRAITATTYHVDIVIVRERFTGGWRSACPTIFFKRPFTPPRLVPLDLVHFFIRLTRVISSRARALRNRADLPCGSSSKLLARVMSALRLHYAAMFAATGILRIHVSRMLSRARCYFIITRARDVKHKDARM